ncbi:MAG: sulfatase [Magnetococcales bacterium]|nr:sulfatase [Magnetococcales bacterium]
MLSLRFVLSAFLLSTVLFCLPVAEAGEHRWGHQKPIPRELVSPLWKNYPPIFLILIDTLRFDHTSVSGYARDTTPNLAELAEESYVFTQAKSSSSWTMPAVSSLFWGLHPFNHGNIFEPDEDSPLPLATGSLIQTFQEQGGYHTLSIQRNKMVDYVVGDFDESYSFTGSDRLDEDAVEEAISWLETPEAKQTRPFMFLGLFNPHWPYNATLDQNNYFERYLNDRTFKRAEKVVIDSLPSPSGNLTMEHLSDSALERLGPPGDEDGAYRDGRMYVAAYDAGIHYTDDQLGTFFDKLKMEGLYDSSLIIVFSDHGEILLDHGASFRHGTNLLDAELAIPLVVKFPHQKRKKEISTLVRSFDLLPTILDWLNLEIPPMDARSMMPLLLGQRVDSDNYPVISYTDSAADTEQEGEMISLYRNGMHLIEYKDDEEQALYDLNRDPEEQSDLASDREHLCSLLQSILCTTYCD